MSRSRHQIQIPKQVFLLVIPFILLIFLATSSYKVVQPGHVAVAVLFGEVQDKSYEEGLYFPVNPLYDWTEYDARQKTHMEQAGVPSQDQLITMIDVSVQFRLRSSMAASMLRETGTTQQVIDVHLVPKLRSLLRELGKTVKRAEDFFLEETQGLLQVALIAGLQDYLAPKGIDIQDVLIRDIDLPDFIEAAIESKKEREQEVEKQKAELERFRTEQEQVVVEARAQREAAEEEAARRRLLADAQAYEIEKINQAISDNPAYVQLEALKTLGMMSKDPATKLYFIDGDSPMPLPLMHLGEGN